MTPRNIRLAHTISKALQDILNPLFHFQVSIMQVSINPKLTLCKVYIASSTYKATDIDKHKTQIRHSLAKSMTFRQVPELAFIEDKSIDNILSILQS